MRPARRACGSAAAVPGESRAGIELGADVSVRNEAGDTALHSAVYKAWPAVVRLLVDHGGDLDAANEAQRTPRQMMCH